MTDFMAVPRGGYIEADILTKGDVLYSGRVAEPFISSSGELVGVLLSAPRRFEREDYLKAKTAAAGQNPDKVKYWRDIPSETFFVNANEIGTINIRNVVPRSDFQKELDNLLGQRVIVVRAVPLPPDTGTAPPPARNKHSRSSSAAGQ